MSLQETVLINMFKRLGNNTTVLDPLLPPSYVDMINKYGNVELQRAFVRAISNKHYQLSNYFLVKVFNQNKDEMYEALGNTMVEAVKINIVTDMDIIEFLFNMNNTLVKIIIDIDTKKYN